TEVWVSLNSPPLAWPGFKSKVSIWLGPPFIHKRIQDLRRFGSVAVSAASLSIQPDVEYPTTPAAVRFIQSRRDKRSIFDCNMGRLLVGGGWREVRGPNYHSPLTTHHSPY